MFITHPEEVRVFMLGRDLLYVLSAVALAWRRESLHSRLTKRVNFDSQARCTHTTENSNYNFKNYIFAKKVDGC